MLKTTEPSEKVGFFVGREADKALERIVYTSFRHGPNAGEKRGGKR